MLAVAVDAQHVGGGVGAAGHVHAVGGGDLDVAIGQTAGEFLQLPRPPCQHGDRLEQLVELGVGERWRHRPTLCRPTRRAPGNIATLKPARACAIARHLRRVAVQTRSLAGRWPYVAGWANVSRRARGCRTRCPRGRRAPPSSLRRSGRCRRVVHPADHPVDLGLLIVSLEIQVDAVLDDLFVGRGDEDPGWALHPAGGCKRTSPSSSTSCGQPSTSAHHYPSAVASWASMQISSNLSAHSANSFLSTLPIALRGKLSTIRTSLGRLCAESCSAT